MYQGGPPGGYGPPPHMQTDGQVEWEKLRMDYEMGRQQQHEMRMMQPHGYGFGMVWLLR